MSSNSLNVTATSTTSSAMNSSTSSGSGAQDYFSFQPQFQPNFHIRERAPRHTTITTRELRFPAGCDCHPSGNAYKYNQQRYVGPVVSWQPHGRPEYIERNSSTDSSASVNSDSSSTSGSATRRFAALFRRTSS